MVSLPSSMPISWRVPNRVYGGLAIIVVLLTWALLIFAYPLLPARIPIHFNISGAVDGWAMKHWWLVFMPALFQTLLVPVTLWLGRHPEWSNLPSRQHYNEMDAETQRIIGVLLAHMLVMIGLIASITMAHIALGMVRVGLGLANRLNSWVMVGLAVLLLTVIGVYTWWLRRVIDKAVAAAPTN